VGQYQKIESCRVCESSEFTDVIDLGMQSYTGVFVDPGKDIEKVPLVLVKCNECGLTQLGHHFDLNIMYGDGYGYRSSQNSWMVNHLKKAVKGISGILNEGDLVVEIGSNDATSFSFFPANSRLVGVDPSAGPLVKKYPKNSRLITEFFSKDVASDILSSEGKARIVMSFSMFYDLPDPIEFAKNVSSLLSKDGVWMLEQSYLLSMLEIGSFDTVCHEHLEYYRLCDIEYILREAGLKVFDVSMNEANGGSFRVYATHQDNDNYVVSDEMLEIRRAELSRDNDELWREFIEKVHECRENVLNLVSECKDSGVNLYGIGASTKGNVLLQYCELTEEDIVSIGEINTDKIGKVCPGSKIPIVSEDEVLADQNGVYLVMPWHFKSFFVNADKYKGKRLVFPLPTWEVFNG